MSKVTCSRGWSQGTEVIAHCFSLVSEEVGINRRAVVDLSNGGRGPCPSPAIRSGFCGGAVRAVSCVCRLLQNWFGHLLKQAPLARSRPQVQHMGQGDNLFLLL